MGMLKRLISFFYQKTYVPSRLHRRKNRKFYLLSEEVRKVSITDEDAKERSIGLIESLLSLHYDVDFSMPKPDDRLLSLILEMLKQHRTEERDIQEMITDLHRDYAVEIFEVLRDYLKWQENSYADFRQTLEIMNSAKRMMQRTQVTTHNLKEIIIEMRDENNRLEDDQEGIEDEGFFKFIKYTALIFGAELSAIIGIFSQTGLSLTTKVYSIGTGFFLAAYITWYVFGFVYKRFLITGARRVLSKHKSSEMK